MEKIKYSKEYNLEVKDTVEVLKVKILDAIKHHVEKGYSNCRIVMDKQHSYHVTCEYDGYVLHDAIGMLNREFYTRNIPIVIELIRANIALEEPKNVPIAFNILK